MLILKKESREIFKKPFGKVYKRITDIDNLLFKDHFIISIGDETTNNILNANIKPKIGIIDNIIEREASKHSIEYHALTLNAINPPGTITLNLWETIKKAFMLSDKSDILIVVDGEEDLAVIPCVLMAPPCSIILYGQPGEGIVLVETDKLKEKARKLLDNFEKTRNFKETLQEF